MRNSLYLILFLHQTTTLELWRRWAISCILFCFYIKPQRRRADYVGGVCCILFCFYIKPQRLWYYSVISKKLRRI